MQVRKNNVLLLMGALSFVAVLISGCLKSVDNTPPKPKAYFSIMYMAPYAAPPVKFFINNDESSAAFLSGQYMERYGEVTPGAFAINFKRSSPDSLVAGIPANYYDSLNYYTILLYNTPSKTIQATAIHDDFSTLSDTKTCYRFFNMNPDFQDVDVYFNNELWESGRQYADNIYSSSFYNQFTQKPANSYTVSVKKAGTDSVIAQTSTTLYERQAYTIFLKGMINGTGNNALGIGILQASN